MVNDGNYPFRVHKGERRNRATSSRPTMPYLRSNDLTLYQTYYSIAYEHLFVKCFLILFRISHNARSLIFCVSFPIFPPNFRIRAVRIDYERLVVIISSYFFLVNNALIAAIKSANVFFLTANQKIANPPIPATATEPITIPAICPPESPSFLAGGVISPPPEDLSSYTAVRVVSPVTLKV